MRVLLGALLGLVVLAAPLAAAEVIVLDDNEAFSDLQRIRATIDPVPAAARPGAYGFVRVQLDNADSRAPHRFDVEIWSEHSDPLCRFRRSAIVGPGERGVLHLPLPAGTDWCYVRMLLDGRPTPGERQRFLSTSSSDAFAVLGVHSDGTQVPAADWRGLLKRIVSGTGIQWRMASDLPASFPLLTGYDLILLDSPLSDLDPALLRALVQYVGAGGHLFVMKAPPAFEGALASLETSLAVRAPRQLPDGYRGGRYGLGSWLAAPGVFPTGSSFETWWANIGAARGQGQSRRAGAGAGAGGAPSLLWLPLAIPGLGEVPVLVFFVLLLLFAILAGPVSYTFFKRRRRLAWLLVAIPATGFLFTAAILLYGFFSEGFGISGAMRSFTMLDQRSHEAVVAAGRTLYAGLPVAAIEPGADTFLGVRPRARRDDPVIRLEANLDAGLRFDGVALPSRTPTTFLTTSVGRVRDRLRFKRLDDGSFEVLAGSDFAPIQEQGAMLFRSAEGGYFLSTASGRLAPVGPQDAADLIDALMLPFANAPLDTRALSYNDRSRYRSLGPPRPQVVRPENQAPMWGRQLVGRSLPPGSYLARVAGLPALDDLGLEVEVRAAEHVVLGLLDAEDVLE